MSSYRANVWALVRPLLEPLRPLDRALDFGSGDGWFTVQAREAGVAREVVAVDVQRRRSTLVEPLLYDGARLPFPDRSFDLVFAIDVLHHCPDPAASLRELARCTNRYLLLKDHTYSTPLGRLTLALLDEIGNRRFGVPSLYRYQRGWEWWPVIEAEGFRLRELIHPARCESRPPISWFSATLQFVGLWERVATEAAQHSAASSTTAL